MMPDDMGGRETEVSITVNGKATRRNVPDTTLLSDYLREELRLTGTHVGCDTSQCWACAVLVNGKAVKACTALAVSLDGAEVTTVEGLANSGLHPMQMAFNDHHGLQCGYCTPGMIIAGIDMVTRYRADGRTLDEAAIRHELEGNICRCTGYHNIVKAIGDAAAKMWSDRGDTDMTDGIGARVKRREDKRFITGKGKYTDDIRMENQAYAAFVRSPHGSARVKGIDASAALAMEGVEAVLTGPEMKADGIGDIITGWAITSRHGSHMQCGVWNPMVTEFARYVGDAVAIVVADTQASWPTPRTLPGSPRRRSSSITRCYRRS